MGGSAPVDNDTVVIASGHVVEFDVDTSGFANGIAGITVTGTLKLTRTTGVYYLKIKAATTIAGAGTFDCGTSGSPIPFAAKHTITGGAAWYIQGSGGLTMTVYAAEPTIKTVLLTGAESAGATVLEVDTNVTGDIWAAGDTIRIDNINKAANSEERVIAAGGIAAGAITITAGLTGAKVAGTLVHLITRNVKFIGVGASGRVVVSTQNGKLTIAGGQWTTANYRVLNTCTEVTISGGTFYGNTYALEGCSRTVITGGIFSGNTYAAINHDVIYISGGTFSGNSYACGGYNGASISGGLFAGNSGGLRSCPGSSISGGTFDGNGSGVESCAGVAISGGIFSNNTYGITTSSISIINATFTGNSYDLSVCVFTAFNTLFGSGTENRNYNVLSKETYSESLDHDQTAGAFRAWTAGGITSSVASPVPTGYSTAYNIALANASIEGFWQREISVSPGASVNIEMWLRKDASMAYLPRCIIFNKASTDPFAGGTPLNTFTMTDSVDTWEDDLYTYTNVGSSTVTLVIRFLGKNATGNVYTALTVEQINVDLTSALALLATIESAVDDLEGRLTAARAGYLDNLSAGAAALEATVAALNNLSAAEVNAEVVDALNVDTYAEPGQEAPGATVSLVKKLGFLYKAFRNRITQTEDTLSLYADDGATVDQKATVGDDGSTYDRGELESGP